MGVWFRRSVRPSGRVSAAFWWEGDIGPIFPASPAGQEMQRGYIRLLGSLRTASGYLRVLHPNWPAGTLVRMTGSQTAAEMLTASALRHGHTGAEAHALIAAARAEEVEHIRRDRRHRRQVARRPATPAE